MSHYYYKRRKKRKKRTGRIIGFVFILLLLFAVVLVIKTFTYPFVKPQNNTEANVLPHSLSEKSIKRLVGAIQIPTVSEYVNVETNNPFDRFKTYLTEVFPQIYSTMDTLTVNKYGLLFHCKGSDNTRQPILFLAHYDVVPVVGYSPLTDPPAEPVYRLNDPAKAPITEYQNR